MLALRLAAAATLSCVVVALSLGAARAWNQAASGAASSRRSLRPGAVALTAAPPQTTELTLPFDGIWGVIQGADSGDSHTGYAAYAIDFVPAERLADALPEKARRRLADFPCFGRAVLAPAPGQVVVSRDGAPDHPPHNRISRDPGNFIIIEHISGEFSELRHLRRGSLRVRRGDRVIRGQPLAECGNSGNAHTPHLHFGFLGSIDPIATRPLRFSRYEVLRRDVADGAGAWTAGDGLPSTGQLLRRTLETVPKQGPPPPIQNRK